jgi:hypothetical protein
MAITRVLPGALSIVLILSACGTGNGNGLDWPPALESLFDPIAQECVVPECDESGDPGFDPSGSWWRTLTTMASNCPDIVEAVEPLAVVGNVDEQSRTIDGIQGTCQYDREGVHLGTVLRGSIARCQRLPAPLDATKYETGLAEFEGDTGVGVVRVYVRELIGTEDGCEIDLDVHYQRE